MSITVLEVGPEHTLPALKKLVRRYAMTGGVEIALRQDLVGHELDILVDRFLPELEKERGQGARFFACTAYRVLALVSRQGNLGDDQRALLLGKLNN